MTPLKSTRIADRRKPSQQDVATAVGINQGFYSRLENGDTRVSAEIAEKLADYFRVDVDQIFTPTEYAMSA
jgi:transcriptional regulator with XRE-family HTH domain